MKFPPTQMTLGITESSLAKQQKPRRGSECSCKNPPLAEKKPRGFKVFSHKVLISTVPAEM